MEVYNPTELLYEEIDEEKRKVRLLICNSNDEILVAHYNGIYMLPGGSLEENEKFDKAIRKALRREIKEEVGIDIEGKPIKYFHSIEYWQKNYPKVNGKVINRLVTTDYYKAKMDIDLDSVESNLTDREKEGGFHLEWIHKHKLYELITTTLSDNPRSGFFHNEFKLILERYLTPYDFYLIEEKFQKLKPQNDGYIDLHTHTIYSDGDLEPNELIENAINNNIGTISITDHDSIWAYYMMADNKNIKNGLVKLIPGVELSAKVNKGRMHILGYDFDIYNKELNEKVNELRNIRIYKIIALLNQIRLDYGITFDKEDISKLFNKKGNLGRPDLAKLCVKYGFSSDVQDAFDKYLIDAYQKTRLNDDTLTYEECIKLIKDAGGISVLAHPKQLLLEDDELEELLIKLIDCGLDGIEVYHSSHTKKDEEKYLALAEKYNLLVSAGSDYHGKTVKPSIELGSCKVKKLSILDKIT